jgi:hypothetical protein
VDTIKATAKTATERDELIEPAFIARNTQRNRRSQKQRAATKKGQKPRKTGLRYGTERADANRRPLNASTCIGDGYKTEKAGDEIRTRDIQLGKLALYP